MVAQSQPTNSAQVLTNKLEYLVGLIRARQDIEHQIQITLSEIPRSSLATIFASDIPAFGFMQVKYNPGVPKDGEESSPAQTGRTENARPEDPTEPSDSSAGIPIARPGAAGFPLASLKIAKGWEEKLIGLGVATVGDLGKFIFEKRLVPGFAPRIGPDACDKIKAAWRAFVYPSGEEPPPSGTSTAAPAVASPAASLAAPPPIPVPEKSDDQIREEGAEFARLGYKASENPHPAGSAKWKLWDDGWQEYFATHDADDEATREDSSGAAAATPQEEFPDLDLGDLETAGTYASGRPGIPAAAVSSSILDTSDL